MTFYYLYTLFPICHFTTCAHRKEYTLFPTWRFTIYHLLSILLHTMTTFTTHNNYTDLTHEHSFIRDILLYIVYYTIYYIQWINLPYIMTTELTHEHSFVCGILLFTIYYTVYYIQWLYWLHSMKIKLTFEHSFMCDISLHPIYYI